MHHLHPTRHANTAPIHPAIHPRDGGGGEILRTFGIRSSFIPDDPDFYLRLRFKSLPICSKLLPLRGEGKWPNGSNMGSVNIFSLFEIVCSSCTTKEGCTMYSSKSVFPFPPTASGVDGGTGGNPERWENKSRSKSGGKCLGCRPLQISPTSKVGEPELTTRKSGKYICGFFL